MASNDDLLFAEHAVKGGFLTDEQVRDSLRVQERMAEMGVPESLRNVLVKRGVLREGDSALVARSAGLKSGREPIPGYTLEARVGSGAMGSVYRAYQRAMKRHVAIKILRRDLTDDPRQVERLQREAALVGKLDHTNIVRGLDCGQSDGLVWFVMEYVEGRTLQARIRKDGPLAPDDAVTLTRQMAEALAHAHEHRIVHRDVKPGNILLTTEDEPRLTDYGLAKGESDDALTHLDATLGTPQYIAPEQARNPRDADIRSDIYSLGATLYAMLAGRPPFQAESLAATLTKVLYDRPQPLSEAAPGTPANVVYVVERMMAKDRRHRYASPVDLVRDLKALEAGRLHVPAGFRGDIEAFVEARRRRRLWTTGVAVAVVAIVASVATVAWQGRVERTAFDTAARENYGLLEKRLQNSEARDGSTVESMIRALEAHLGAFPNGPTASDAQAELDRWERQATAIERVQELSRRASGDGPADWPRLLADLRAELARLARNPDADVALTRLRSIVVDAERARDGRAEEAARAATNALEAVPLLEAAHRLESEARHLRDRFYGLGDAPQADAVTGVAHRFRAAQNALDGHFATYETAASSADLPRADLRDLERRLYAVFESAQDDDALAGLLQELPPAGSRRALVAERYEAARRRLTEASQRRWEQARAEIARLLSARRFADALARLDTLATSLLANESDAALGERDRIVLAREVEAREVAKDTDDAAERYFDAVGLRHYRDAADQLTELESFTAGWTTPDDVSGRLITQGRRLLELIDTRAWSVLRRRLTSPEPLADGLSVGTGIRYREVRQITLRGDELDFTYGDGQTWRCGVREIELVDVLRYTGLPGATAEGALVAAALAVLETSSSSEPAVVLERIVAASPRLEAARSAKGMEEVVTRLADRARNLEQMARGELAEREDRARALHEDALRMTDNGQYADAWTRLDSLLTLPRLYRTEYVRRRREEIQRERGRASEGRETVRYAQRLPGARLTERGDGTAALVVDFEDEDVERAVRLTQGHTAILERGRVAAHLPGGGDAPPVARNGFFAWAPWDGVPVHHPRLFPLTVDIPFAPRRRVELSFLYRSDAPFFLLVSIGGTTAGVLSAEDVREAGRGVAIWQSETLDAPDENFSERHRSGYIEKHPEVLAREGAGEFFGFEAGRVYRVRFVKDDRRASLWIDGRRVMDADLRTSAVDGPMRRQVVIASYTSGEIDDVVVTGILDPDWLKRDR